jgi:nucleotide-binding universal stress UspA family protein
MLTGGTAMSKVIVLAVDAARIEPGKHVTAAVEMIKELAADTGDRVVVLHVHEFAVGRFGRIQVDCQDGAGEQLVSDVVAELIAAGVSAEGVIREADFGHVARAILAAAHEHDARILALGSSSHTDLPLVTFGSIANRVLHQATLPVIIVPMRYAAGNDPS